MTNKLFHEIRTGAVASLGAICLLSQSSHAEDCSPVRAPKGHHVHAKNKWVALGPLFFETPAAAPDSDEQATEETDSADSESSETEERGASESEEPSAEPPQAGEAPDASVMAGSFSFLQRGKDGIDFIVRATGLTPGHVYSLNAVIFNAPEECTGNTEHPQFRCGRDDLTDHRGGHSFINLTGTLLTHATSFTFRGHREEGNARTFFEGEGLKDALHSEIMFDVWDMGAPIPGLLEQQLSSPNAGCGVGEPNDHGGKCVDLAGNAL